MGADRILTPLEVSRRLGVNPKTVTRCAELGALPCFKTPGGHRRLRESDIITFREERTEVIPEAAEDRGTDRANVTWRMVSDAPG